VPPSGKSEKKCDEGDGNDEGELRKMRGSHLGPKTVLRTEGGVAEGATPDTEKGRRGLFEPLLQLGQFWGGCRGGQTEPENVQGDGGMSTGKRQ
jgi:hypothetical protein